MTAPRQATIRSRLSCCEGEPTAGLDIEIDVWKGKYANPATAPSVAVGSSATALEPFRLD